MRFSVRRMAGAARRLAPDRTARRLNLAGAGALLALLLSAVPATAQSLYKYRGESGEWMYSDRPPDDDSLVEVRALEQSAAAGEVSVRYVIAGAGIDLVADNGLYAPVELKLRIDAIQGLHVPADDPELRWVLPSRSATVLITLDLLDKSSEPSIDYRFEYLAGDPGAQHRPSEAYRVPFSIASDFPVSQAYPDNKTHVSPDSYYAIDVAMPIGTDIFAARAGIVFDVASDNFKSGLNPERDGPLANVVRILHDDGTYAIYAHLNWNSIRVKPGDRVERGQYIADSGNTGFSSGPHLHFAVVRNAGLRIESVPIEFQGAGTTSVKPATGMALKAY